MDATLEWGLDVIRLVQTIQGPALTMLMKVLTQAGSEYFYILFLPIIFWCVDSSFGARFGLVFIFSSFTNGWLKVLFALPRPFSFDPALGLSHETSFALPSGHAQGTATFWGLLSNRIRKPWGLVLALGLPLIIGFTRIYLGVHFPTDLFLGWGLGWGIAFSWVLFGDRIAHFIARTHTRARIIAAAAVALGMNALHPEDPSMAGAFFGTALGAVLMFRHLGFDASAGTRRTKLLRMIAGLVGLAAVYFGGKLLSPAPEAALYNLVRFVRYAAVGAWVSLGAPWFFARLGLGDERR
jgi:membrane-associated phospholipid phosphatase